MNRDRLSSTDGYVKKDRVLDFSQHQNQCFHIVVTQLLFVNETTSWSQ